MIRQENIKPCDYLSWEIPHDGWHTVKVTYVGRSRVSYNEPDGYPSYRGGHLLVDPPGIP